MMTFPEWLYQEYKDDVVGSIEDAVEYVRDMSDWIIREPHYGDCVKQNVSCKICTFQTLLDEYEEYCRDKVNKIKK